MPRYFFDVHDHRDMPDTDGTVLADRQAVRGQAIACAGEILKDIDGKFTGEEWSMTVRDEAGHVVLTLRFSAIES